MKFSSKFTDQYFDLSTAVQFALWFMLILILKYDTLLAPPVWDTAMGIFPPAIFLYEHSFDISLLINQNGWWEGGPNVYSLSSWTWFVAFIMSITDNATTTFFTAHGATFVLTAYAIALMVKTTRELGVSSYLALLSGLLLLLLPLVLVQVGYMYTEILVMAFSIYAWVSWHHGQEGRAVTYTVIAISIKLTGLIIGLCIFPLLVLRLIQQFSFKRLALIILIPLSYLISTSLYNWLGGADITPEMPWGSFEQVYNGMLSRIKTATDIHALFVVSTCATVIYSLFKWFSIRSFNPFPALYKYCVNDGTISIAIIYSFLFCLGVMVNLYQGHLFLLRYTVPMIPFLLLQIVISGQALRIQPVVAIVFVGVCLFSIYNHNGKTYSHSSAFSIVENSHAYKGFLLAQKTMIEQIAQLDDKIPIYVSREIDYMTSHPMMGYLDKIKPNIIGIHKKEYSGFTIERFVSEYYIARTNHGHGTHRLNNMLKIARDAKDWRTEKIYTQRISNRSMAIDYVYEVTEADTKFESTLIAPTLLLYLL